MKSDNGFLKKIIQAIRMTRPEEIDCAQCFDEMDHFAELELKGKSPGEALPLVQEHLNKCGDCRQEYEALLTALQAADELSGSHSQSTIIEKIKALFRRS